MIIVNQSYQLVLSQRTAEEIAAGASYFNFGTATTYRIDYTIPGDPTVYHVLQADITIVSNEVLVTNIPPSLNIISGLWRFRSYATISTTGVYIGQWSRLNVQSDVNNA